LYLPKSQWYDPAKIQEPVDNRKLAQGFIKMFKEQHPKQWEIIRKTQSPTVKSLENYFRDNDVKDLYDKWLSLGNQQAIQFKPETIPVVTMALNPKPIIGPEYRSISPKPLRVLKPQPSLRQNNQSTNIGDIRSKAKDYFAKLKQIQ
jgi:hypothetical protein